MAKYKALINNKTQDFDTFPNFCKAVKMDKNNINKIKCRLLKHDIAEYNGIIIERIFKRAN